MLKLQQCSETVQNTGRVLHLPATPSDTHKVSDGSQPPVLVLLKQAAQQAAHRVRLARRQGEGLVQDAVVHLRDVVAVVRRLQGS